jgi:hypothetical protein
MPDPVATAAPTTAPTEAAPPAPPAEPKVESKGTGKAKRPTMESLRAVFQRARDEAPAEPGKEAPKEPAKEAAPAHAEAKPEPKVEPKAEPADDDEVFRSRRDYDLRASDLDAREKELEAREKAAGERERGSDHKKLRDRYLEDRVEAMKELLKGWSVAGDDDMAQEMEDFATEVVEKVLKKEIESERKAGINNRKTQKALKMWQAEQARQRTEMDETRATESHKQELQRAAATVQSLLGRGENLKRFPWLAVERDAGQLIIDRWKHYNDKDGTNKHWTDVAKELDSKFEKHWRGHYDARKNLFSASEPTTDAQATQPAAALVDRTRAADHQAADKKPNAEVSTGRWKGSDAKRKATQSRIAELLKQPPR